jgi:hypothetical protein
MEKTLIVLCAGASKDFCRIFPTGLELIKEINYHFFTQRKSDDPTEYVSDMMNQLPKSLPADRFEQIKKVLWKIQANYEWYYLRSIHKTLNSSRSVNFLSIDKFIAEQIGGQNLNNDDKNIIKFCIYYLIKGYEQALKCEDVEYWPSDCWIDLLAKKVSKLPPYDIIENLEIITFNYDRTFEHYFPIYLQANGVTLGEEQISTLQSNVKHVYGSLGSLVNVPIYSGNNEGKIKEEGIYGDIKLIDDRETSEISIENAGQFKKVHFIGFGYDTINIARINLKRFSSATIAGTAYRYEKMQLEQLKKDYPEIEAMACTCKCYIEKKFSC